MINPAIIENDADYNIAEWPVSIRHYYNDTQYDQCSANMYATSEISVLEPGGLLDQMSMEMTASREDFPNGLPQNRDRVDLLLHDGVTWLTLIVKRTPDLLDPINPLVNFTLGTPDA